MEANTGREKAHTNTAPWTCENLGSRRSSSPDRKPLHYTIMDRVCKPLHAPTGSITSSTPPSVRLLVPKANCSMVLPRNLPAPLPTSDATLALGAAVPAGLGGGWAVSSHRSIPLPGQLTSLGWGLVGRKGITPPWQPHGHPSPLHSAGNFLWGYT